MSKPLNLRTMKVIVEGEVNSPIGLMALRRSMKKCGESWLIQQEQISDMVGRS